MKDCLTLDKWRGEFAIWAANEERSLDLTIMFVRGQPYWESTITHRMFGAYCKGRMQERPEIACELAQKRISEVLRLVDFQDLSYSGRGES